MTALARRPALRWLVPIAVIAVILGGSALTSAVRASAGSDLPHRSAAQLLADLRLAKLDAATGTVVEHADLGLPALPSGFGGEGSADFTSLLTGAHTMRVWYSGPEMVRVSLVGALAESDVIRNKGDLWVWSSSDNTATHAIVPTGRQQDSRPLPSPLPSRIPLTPLDAANDIIAALSPTTSITSAGSVTVAGRPAYQLVIAPKDPASLVANVRIALDAARHIPLRVQVFAARASKPAFEIGFTQVSFNRPDASVFDFNPPPGATVKQAPSGGHSDAKPPAAPATPSAPSEKPRVIGSGWTAVLDAPVPADALQGSQGGRGNPLGALLKQLPTVRGGFGSGKLLQTTLVSVLLTDDGRIFIGSVDGARLVATASTAGK